MEDHPAFLARNLTVVVTEEDDILMDNRDEKYEQFLADVWVGVVLTLMVLSCVCCVCSCLLYHKFQQWKRNVLESRATSVESGERGTDAESLPSYTIVSGLPSYEEALDQLRQVRQMRSSSKGSDVTETATANPQHQPPSTIKLSVAEFLQLYKSYPPL